MSKQHTEFQAQPAMYKVFAVDFRFPRVAKCARSGCKVEFIKASPNELCPACKVLGKKARRKRRNARERKKARAGQA